MKSPLLSTIFANKPTSEYIALRALRKSKLVKSVYVATVTEALEFCDKYATTADVYFGVCSRKEAKPEKQHVGTAYCLWADLDPYHVDEANKTEYLREALQSYILPPTFIVDSGGGFHVYWMLSEPTTNLEEVEEVNGLIEHSIRGAGSVGDTARILRVDSSFNFKQENARPVILRVSNIGFSYSMLDLRNVVNLEHKERNRIVTGETRGFKSKSERDWRSVCDLVKAGLSDDAIKLIFSIHPIGDKYRKPAPSGGDKYLDHTIERAREELNIQPDDVADSKSNFGGIIEDQDCYWVLTSKGRIQLSTFTFQPQILLTGNSDADQDTLVGTIRAADHSWPEIPLRRQAFVHAAGLIKELPKASWQWLGNDAQVKTLLPYLMEVLRAKGLPQRTATQQIGWFEGGYWLGSYQTMSSKGILDDKDKPVTTLATVAERPEVSYTSTEVSDEELDEFIRLFSKLNEEGIVWPILGWTASCVFKSRYEKDKIRFPVLNLYGTRGSGKTTLITSFIQTFMGYDKPRTYDCTTTKFVMLSAMGSSNGVPVSFSEFRSGARAMWNINRYILLSYDNGHDPRGRPDQSVTDYRLSAPFTVDGNDAISEAAAMERIIQLNLHPETIKEGSVAYDAFQDLAMFDVKSIGSAYIRFALGYEYSFDKALKLCRDAFPQPLPDRVRRNLAVVIMGLQCFESFAKAVGASAMPKVDVDFLVEVLSHTLEQLVNTSGRSSILVDEFIEDLVNQVVLNSQSGTRDDFVYTYDEIDNCLWFHLATATSWWTQFRRRQNKETLDTAAIKAQLVERKINGDDAGQYMEVRKTKTINGKSFWCYGINVLYAHNSGLDCPASLKENVFRPRVHKKEKKNDEGRAATGSSNKDATS